MAKKCLHGYCLLLVIFIMSCLLLSNNPAAAANQAVKNPIPFSDISNDLNRVFITYINQMGIISGFPDGKYHPQQGLSRAQAAVVICKAAKLTVSPAAKSPFKDVSSGYWAASYINTAAEKGLLKGLPDGTFRPEATLTRAEGISLIMRLCTQSERAALPSLQDMNNQHWAAKDMATALSLEMISTSQDGKQVYPDAEMTRSVLARSLAILLTKDPGLNQTKLTAILTEIKGEVTLTRNNKTEPLKKDITIYEADIIKTGQDGRARIIYPDGSGNLIEENSEIVIKKAAGKSYIKQDGTAGVAVDSLNIELKSGTLFGALSTKSENKTNDKQAGRSAMFASKQPLKQLAAADTTQPWYKTAEQKKVKVKVDMPWGVAAIRGTFIKVSVNPDGTCDVACLTGSAEVSGSNGASAPLGGGQSSSITTQGSAPTNAAPMSQADKAAFAQEQEWVVNTALLVDTNKAAEVLVETKENQTVEQQTENTVKTVIDALKASGIQLKPEVIEKLKEDIQKALTDEKTVQSLTKDIDTSTSNNTNTNTNTNIITSTSSNSGSSGSGGGSSDASAYIAYNTAGTYGGESSSAVQTLSGSAIINAAGVTLHNLIITGRLTLASGIGEGNVTLQNVTVRGNTVINGGGPDSIEVIDSNLYTVTVDKANNSIRIVAKGSTSIGTLTLNSGATLQEDGLSGNGTGFSSVNTGLNIPAGAMIVLSGSFDSLTLNAPDCQITLADGSSLQSLTANAAVTISGAGRIVNAVINALGVTLAQVPANISLGSGITASIAGQNLNASIFSGTVGCIAGRVVDSNGQGIPGATVIAHIGTGSPSGSPVTTVANGAFILTGMSPGTYMLEVTPPAPESGVNPILYMPVSLAGVNVSAGQITTVSPDLVMSNLTVIPLTAVAVSGNPAVGSTLTAILTPTNATADYSWKAGATQVGTGDTYLVTAADVGKTITVTATGTGNYDGSVTSVPTPAIASPITAVPAAIVLAPGSNNPPVGEITDLAIPAAGGTIGVVTGWTGCVADTTIKFTVTDTFPAVSTITINGSSYTSGSDYVITSAVDSTGTLAIVVTTTQSGCTPAIRTFIVKVEAQEEQLFSNWNAYDVASGPSTDTTFTIDEPYAITYIDTYQFNSGAGETPGTISFRSTDGTTYGPWSAIGYGPDNVVWVINNKSSGEYEDFDSGPGGVTPGTGYPVIPAGTYTIIDSSPLTWSYNSQSGGAGFAQVKGYAIATTNADIIGTVKNGEGNPLAGVTVNAYYYYGIEIGADQTVYFLEMPPNASAVTDSNGEYSLSIPSDNDYFIKPMKTGLKYSGSDENNIVSPCGPCVQVIKDITMVTDDAPYSSTSTNITISGQDQIDYYNGLILTANEPLTDQSWLNILATIKQNMDSVSGTWVTGDPDYLYLFVASTGDYGFLYYYNDNNNDDYASIISDFTIPKNMIEDLAGNHPQANVVIDSYSLTPQAALLQSPANYGTLVSGQTAGTTKITGLTLPSGSTKWQIKVGDLTPSPLPGPDSIVSGASDYNGEEINIPGVGTHLLLLATDDTYKVKAYADLAVMPSQVAGYTTMTMSQETPGVPMVPYRYDLVLSNGTIAGTNQVTQLVISGTANAAGSIVLMFDDGVVNEGMGVNNIMSGDSAEAIAGKIKTAVETVLGSTIRDHYTVSTSGDTVLFTYKKQVADHNVSSLYINDYGLGVSSTTSIFAQGAGAGNVTVTVTDEILTDPVNVTIYLPGNCSASDAAQIIGQKLVEAAISGYQVSVAGSTVSITASEERYTTLALADTDSTQLGNITGVEETGSIQQNKLQVTEPSSGTVNLKLVFDDGVKRIVRGIALTNGETMAAIATAIKAAFDGMPDYTVTNGAAGEVLFTRTEAAANRNVIFYTYPVDSLPPTDQTDISIYQVGGRQEYIMDVMTKGITGTIYYVVMDNAQAQLTFEDIRYGNQGIASGSFHTNDNNTNGVVDGYPLYRGAISNSNEILWKWIYAVFVDDDGAESLNIDKGQICYFGG